MTRHLTVTPAAAPIPGVTTRSAAGPDQTGPARGCGLWGRSRMTVVIAPPALRTGPRSWATTWWRRPRAWATAAHPPARPARRPGHHGART